MIITRHSAICNRCGYNSPEHFETKKFLKMQLGKQGWSFLSIECYCPQCAIALAEMYE